MVKPEHFSILESHLKRGVNYLTGGPEITQQLALQGPRLGCRVSWGTFKRSQEDSFPDFKMNVVKEGVLRTERQLGHLVGDKLVLLGGGPGPGEVA